MIAVRTLEATRAEAWDVDGRQGAVDVMLTLNDGRTAAFEVTNLAADGALEAASLLARDNHKWGHCPVTGFGVFRSARRKTCAGSNTATRTSS
jgi:hypothetical protein